ncbi:hypothetical protein MHU86_7746 [Fragilaria crotonensis]|nr:hypothetical protein MHU86_7746 [Fragilaria crotonensis]
MTPIVVATTFLLLLLSIVSLDAYRLGDAVDTILRTDSSADDVLRSQMPLFGQSTKALFTVGTLPSSHFSLSFEEGLRPLPWVNLMNSKGQMLQRLQVTFAYSRSGEGAIYGISSDATYGEKSDTFLVQYTWVEEGEVNPRAASAAIFLLVFLASVLMLISSCSLSIEGESTGRDNRSGSHVAYGGYEQPVGVPKWD